MPSGLTLDSQPMGRGTVQLLNGENGRGHLSRDGSYFTGAPEQWRVSSRGLLVLTRLIADA